MQQVIYRLGNAIIPEGYRQIQRYRPGAICCFKTSEVAKNFLGKPDHNWEPTQMTDVQHHVFLYAAPVDAEEVPVIVNTLEFTSLEVGLGIALIVSLVALFVLTVDILEGAKYVIP